MPVDPDISGSEAGAAQEQANYGIGGILAVAFRRKSWPSTLSTTIMSLPQAASPLADTLPSGLAQLSNPIAVPMVFTPIAASHNMKNVDLLEGDDMIYTDLFFPGCITYGSTVSPRYKTSKTQVESGSEQRNQRSRQALHEYNIVMENMLADEVAQVVNLWHVCSGDFAAFMFTDPADHTSSNTAASHSGSDITAEDQILGEYTGGSARFNLTKRYVAGSYYKERRIYYPDTDSIQIAVDGHFYPDWLWDASEKQLVFSFNVGAAINVFGTVTIAGDVFTFSDGHNLNAGSLLTLSNIPGASPGAIGATPLRVSNVINAQTVTVELYDGSLLSNSYNYDGAHNSVTMERRHPPVGSTVTAGYMFYVPVRFKDGDNADLEMVAGKHESLVATAPNVSLVEVLDE